MRKYWTLNIVVLVHHPLHQAPRPLVVLDVLTLYHNILTQLIVLYSTLANAERALF